MAGCGPVGWNARSGKWLLRTTWRCLSPTLRWAWGVDSGGDLGLADFARYRAGRLPEALCENALARRPRLDADVH